MTRVALVTGGARGIGRAIALNLSRDHDVAVTSRDARPDSLPESIACIQADFTRPESFASVISAVMARFGRIDVIVNNAGLVAQTPKDAFDPDVAHELLGVNLVAPAGLLSAALPHLGAGASVVNISSVNSVLPPRDAAIYGASKAALNLWTRAMAKELGPRGIRVNAVAPSAIESPERPRPPNLTKLFVDQTALGRIGTPEDVARAVRFLAGDEAGFITGEVLTVSGGYRL
jgi:3-oxoacyl-[acyl-carrier protein] reductase